MITAKYIIKKIKAKRVRRAMKATLRGTPERPRMIMVKSNKYLYTQVIDDASHQVLLRASTLEKELKAKLKSAKNKEAAKLLGETIAERLKEKKIERSSLTAMFTPMPAASRSSPTPPAKRASVFKERQRAAKLYGQQ